MRQELTVAYLSFDHVGYAVDGRKILTDISFEVERGETLVLLGRSGAGKSTALRLINRMLKPSGGSIHLDGQDVSQADPIALRRKTGYVIQDLGLLPHWTVAQNIALVPRLLGWTLERQRQRALELLEQVGLTAEMGERRPSQLSGGQRQRVAVARALAAEPGLLLFDEPFGALDPVTRREMQQQFLALRSRYNVASVFVTHDVLEALALGTRIAVLNGGELECLVTPQELLHVGTPVARSFVETLP
jgi:osmoprotectant transport system ATP-binding protein